MRKFNKFYVITIFTFMYFNLFAGEVTVSLVGNDPLTVNVKGNTANEEAAAFSVFIYFNSDAPADAVSTLDPANVNSTQLTDTFGWTTTFEAKTIETGSWLKDGVTYTSRLNYAHSNVISGVNDDVWPTSGVDVLILDFDPGGPGSAYIELNGADGIPNYSTDAHTVTFVNQSVSPLPVELSTFSVNSVEGANAELNWETATEVNNHGFSIERSILSEGFEKGTESAVWEEVAFVEGHGNSNSPKLYSYTDANLVGGSKFMYRLKQIDIDGTFEYSDVIEIEVVPNNYELLQNYPNPFNPSTLIRFSLPEDTQLAINIYNILGEKVATVLNEELKAGFHQVNFNTNSAGYSLASGIYIYTLESKNFSQVKKMILMK